jgi:Subtilase family
MTRPAYSVINDNDIQDAFQLKELVQIYNYPAPDTSISPVVFVVSLGGGLYGASYTSAGLLIADGKNDIHKTWKNQGIHPSNYPAVYVVNNTKTPVAASNLDTSATLENTLDVATIGACCPNPNLTIVLYVFDYTESTVRKIETALEGTIIGGKLYKPSVISISWGTPESIFELNDLNRINSILRQAVIDGIQVCAASGDGGSTLNVKKNVLEVPFPASSPYVTAVGGTTLTCPSNNYSDSTTREVVWNNQKVGEMFRASGGGSSKVFLKPQYQQNLPGTYRQVPDIAMCADPGVVIVYKGQLTVVGGTSLATPLYVALLACLKNPTRIPQLTVSQATSYFNDITVGYNYDASVYPGGIVDPVSGSTTKQYVATVGYDNCTGLGSIDGKALATILSGFPRFLTTVTQYFVEPTNINNLPMNVTEVYTFIKAQTTNIYLVRLIDVANALCLLGRTTSSNIINEALSAQSFGEGLLYALVSLVSYINPLNPLTQGALSIGGAIYLVVYTILNPPATVINPTIGEPDTATDIGDPVDLQGTTENNGARKRGGALGG